MLVTADDCVAGRFLYYSHHVLSIASAEGELYKDRPAQRVDWLFNPFNEARHNARLHWCDYPTFSAAAGDIKDLWEPSRFACAFWLVRAYALTGDEKYPQAFWELFESWRQQNPPNLGPNWKCGQETALRSMAWCFALFGFWDSPATTSKRISQMVILLALQAERIAGNIGYAVSQKNNHALSEAVGLLTTAWLFPELKGAAGWAALGRRVLEREVLGQVYEDGSYVQQSMNYHRVMLQDCLWASQLAELSHQPLAQEVTARLTRAAEFLYEVLDKSSGCVPNYGPNDGALVLPLTACDYTDYRPTVQAAVHHWLDQSALAPGPWDEMRLWLFGREDSRPSRAVARSRRFDVGGYYTIRGSDSWCVVRCHAYRDRPAHVDLLHVDMWYGGVNLLGDSGTYKYYVPDDPFFEHYFVDIAAHNTIEVDGVGPLERASRFLWLPWPTAKCLHHGPDRWVGEHYAYSRPPWRVVHRREVSLADPEGWRITDEVLGCGVHTVTLRWHLPGVDARLAVEDRCVQIGLPAGSVRLAIEGAPEITVRLHRGLRSGTLISGWRSDYYGQVAPRPTMEATLRARLPVRLITRVELGRELTG